jgi:hypothetical protein
MTTTAKVEYQHSSLGRRTGEEEIRIIHMCADQDAHVTPQSIQFAAMFIRA